MNINLEKKLIRLAKRIQLSYKPNKVIHITFLLYRNKIISTGINDKRKTHPSSSHPYKSIHSEVDAILKLEIPSECKKYHITNIASIAQKVTLVNMRIMSDGTIGLSKPCKHCSRLIEQIGFKEVLYTNIDGGFSNG